MEKDIYINLIIQQLKGEISDADQEKLLQWENADPENKSFKRSIEESWRLSNQGQKEIEVDTAGDFLKLKQRIDAAKNQTSTKTKTATVKPLKNNRRIFLLVAASLAILVGAFLFLTNQNDSSPQMVLSTKAGETKVATLPDGSKIWLNENSRVAFEEAFEKDERRIMLNGEAYFDVQSNPNKPFVVELENAQVTVLGTSFNVKEDKNIIAVQVDEGKVRLSDKTVQEKVLLLAGEYGTYNSGTNSAQKVQDFKKNRIAWKSKSLIFEDLPLGAVIADIESYFGEKVIVEDDSMLTCSYAGYFPKAEIEKVLSTIASTFEMNLSQESNGNYILKNGICKQ